MTISKWTQVWRGEGEEGRIRAREEMMRQEASIAARRARAEVEARRFRQFAGENGTVQSTHANVFEVRTIAGFILAVKVCSFQQGRKSRLRR